jgi:hypothetical protein
MHDSTLWVRLLFHQLKDMGSSAFMPPLLSIALPVFELLTHPSSMFKRDEEKPGDVPFVPKIPNASRSNSLGG